MHIAYNANYICYIYVFMFAYRYRSLCSYIVCMIWRILYCMFFNICILV